MFAFLPNLLETGWKDLVLVICILNLATSNIIDQWDHFILKMPFILLIFTYVLNFIVLPIISYYSAQMLTTALPIKAKHSNSILVVKVLDSRVFLLRQFLRVNELRHFSWIIQACSGNLLVMKRLSWLENSQKRTSFTVQYTRPMWTFAAVVSLTTTISLDVEIRSESNEVFKE